MDKKIPHILIVDDDANLLRTMSDILKLKGFEPVIAQTGGAALALLEKHNFDLVLLDQRLEDMSGLKVLSAIKARSPETECILLTGHASQNSAIEAIQMGVHGYFQKPFDMEQVLLSIQRALEKRATEKAMRASEVRYRGLFEDSPVAQREEDFSEAKQYLDLLKKQGITNFHEYLKLHPEIVFECVAKVKIVDVNKAALKMFRAKSKNDIPMSFSEILDGKAIEHFRDQLASIAEGQTKFSWEGIDHTVDGQQIDVEVNWLAAAGYEEDLSKVIVSLQDITERKQAEKQIHILSRALEQSPTSILITDVRGNIEYVNPKFSEITGYGLDEVLGENPRILQSGNTPREEYKKLWDTILSGNIWQGEFLNRKKNGEKYWENDTIAPVFSNDGKITNFLSLSEDVTERKQAAAALQNSEKRFRALIENGRDNISLLAEDGTLLWESPSTRSTLGYAPDQFVGHNIYELLHPDDRDPIQELYVQLVQSPGKSQDGIFRLRHGDGTWRWIESTATNMLDEPNVQAIVINYRDITERKRAEEAVLESEERFRVIFEKANDAIHIDNADDKILAVNSRMCELTGYSREELLKMHVTDLQAPETRQSKNVVQTELERHGNTVFEGLNLHRDGRRIPVEISIGTIEMPGGELYISVVRDITERKQAQEAQQQSELLFRTLFELSPDAVMLIDPHDADISWPIIDCNEAACQMNGYHREELIGHSIDIVNLASATRAERNAYIIQVREAGTLKLESFHRHKNGIVFPIEVSTALIKVGDRELLIGIDRDITERKQAEDELRQSEERFQQLANNIEETFWITDAESGREIYISPAAEKIWGIPLEALYQGRYLFLENVLPEDRQIALDTIERQLHGTKTEMEYRIRQPDGSIRWIWDRAFPIVDETGKVVRVAGLTADVTARKQTEIEVRERTEELELINVLNEAINRGDNLDKVMEVFTRELRKISICKDATIYLISSDEKNLVMQNLGLSQSLVKKIEQLIGRPIPQIQVPIREGGYFHHALRSEQGIITTDPKTIQQWMLEFTETKSLPDALRGTVRKLVPQIFKLLAIRSTLVLPLVSDKKVIGLLDVASSEVLTEKDLKRIQKISGQLTAVILREQANEALLDSEERYRLIFDGVQDAIFIESKDGRILGVNNRACEMYGCNRDEFVKKTVADLVPEGSKLFIVPSTQPNISPVPFETINRRANGDLFPVEISGGLQTINGEEILLVIVRDITERRRAEEALYESEERFKNAFQYSAIGMALVSLEGKWLKVNPTMCSIVGYSEGELIAKTFQDITHPDDLDSDLNYLDQLLAGKIKSYTMEKRYFHKEGNIVWVLLTVALAKDNAGTPLYLISQINDITERKRAEEALRESEALYRQAIEVAGAVPYLQSYNKNGAELHYDFISGGIRQITGYEAREFNVALWDSLVEESVLMGDLAGYSFEEAIRRVRSGEIPLWKCEHRILARDGKIRWVFESAVELYTENGIAKGSIGMFQNITERKQAEDALKKGHTHLEKRTAELGAALRETEGLFSTVQDILTSTHLTQICQSMMEHFIDLVKADRTLLYLVDHERQEILLSLGTGSFERGVSMTYQELNAGISGQVFKSGQPVLSVSADDEPPETYEHRVRDNVGSLILVPLLTREGIGALRVIGVVIVINDIGQPAFTQHDKDLLMTMATQAAAAIENIRLYEETSQRVAELELLYESGLAFSQLLNPKEIAQKIIGLLGEKLDWHHTAIRLIRGQDESLELLAFDQPGLADKTEEQAVKAQLSKSVSGFGEGLSGWALKQTKIIRLGNVGSDPHYVQTFPGIQSGLYVPLKSGDRMLGVISIESEQPDAFSEADEQMLTTLANQAANAFENARLYEETNRHAQELEKRVQERTADLSRVNVDLEHAVRVKDEFLASMSHELRTPLTGILGLSEVLQLKVYGELNDKQNKTLKTIEESGRHLLELINDILDLSKIEAGKLELQFAPCSLAEVCQASLQIIKGMAQQKGQHVYYAPPPKPIIIRADARRLKQLLVNLLGNAIKFTPQNGDLGLEIEPIESEQKFKVTVWDKGIGIKPENLSKLFKPFTQLDSGLAREYSGTGLGLSLVKHLTELHNGGIEVESKIGEGSRFTIILPWSPQDTTPITYPYLPQRAVTGRLSLMAHKDSASSLVMIVDDNEMVLQMVADFLETKQYRVMKIHSGSELLERAAEFHPDIMLVDIQMPGIGGLETIRRIRSHTDPLVAAAPVIAITALAMPADREHCLRAGANDYMSKPLKLKELAVTIQKLLERKQ